MSVSISSFVQFCPTTFQVGKRGVTYPAAGQVLGAQLLPTDPIGAAALTFQGLPTGTDIVILASGTPTIVHQVDAHAGTSYGYGYDVYFPARVVDIGFINPGFVPFYIRGLTLPATDALIPVALVADRNFS